MSQCADNFRFSVTAWEGHYDPGSNVNPLRLALALPFLNCRPVQWWVCLLTAEPEHTRRKDVIRKYPRLLFFDGAGIPSGFKPEEAQAFPCPLNADEVEPLIRAWLRGCEYPPEPDHDGDNVKGWTVSNGERYDMAFAIEPTWMTQGK